MGDPSREPSDEDYEAAATAKAEAMVRIPPQHPLTRPNHLLRIFDRTTQETVLSFKSFTLSRTK
jgi:hypothetical protein